MWLFVIVVVAIYIIYRIVTSYTIHHDTVIAFVGGLGSGKTLLSVKYAIRLYKRQLRRYYINRLLGRRMDKPLLYSNIPIRLSRKVWATQLTADHLLLRSRIKEGSVVMIDEIGSFASQWDYNDVNIKDNFDEFIRFFRHYVGGYLVVNDQAVGNILINIRRRLNSVYYLMRFRRFWKLYTVRIRHVSVSDDIMTVENEDTEDNTSLLIGLLPIYKYYESRCYRHRYDRVIYSNDVMHDNYYIDDPIQKPPKGHRVYKLTARSGTIELVERSTSAESAERDA